MIGLDRQGWILVGFAVLFITAIVVSACGWILMWRTRRSRSSPQAGEDAEPDVAAEGASTPPGPTPG